MVQMLSSTSFPSLQNQGKVDKPNAHVLWPNGDEHRITTMTAEREMGVGCKGEVELLGKT